MDRPANASSALLQKNLALVDAVEDIFGLRRKRVSEGESLPRPDGQQVKELYELLGKLWPIGTNIFAELEDFVSRDERDLAAVLYGATGSINANSVSRLGLYLDRLLLADIFWDVHGPAFEAVAGILGSETIADDTIKRVQFIASVKDWIRSGYIALFPNPEWYHADFQQKSTALFTTHVDDFVQWWIRDLSKERHGRAVADRGLKTPHAPARATGADQVSQVRGDFSTLKAVTTSAAIGSIAVTDDTYCSAYYRYLLDKKVIDAQPSSVEAIARAFMRMDLNFLDNVRPEIVHRLRADEDRLKDFRSFLRRTWTKVGKDACSTELSVASFEDELREEYRKQMGEWDNIKGDFIKWTASAGGAAVLSSTASAAISTGYLAPVVLVGAGLVAISQMIDSYVKVKKMKRSGTSVFVELSGQSTLLSRL